MFAGWTVGRGLSVTVCGGGRKEGHCMHLTTGGGGGGRTGEWQPFFKI